MTDAQHSSIIITSYTWSRDSFSLFDYKCKEIEVKNFKGSGSFHIYRDKDNGIYCSAEKLGLNDILHIARWKDTYYVAPSGIDDDSNLYCNQAWNLMNHQEMNHHGFKGKKLNLGDVLKLGRFIFRVKEISHRNTNEKALMATNLDMYLTSFYQTKQLGNYQMNKSLVKRPRRVRNKKSSKRTSQEQEKEDFLCRICLSSVQSKEDPFISPCNCSGTMKYIHFSCIKEWMDSKKSINGGDNYQRITWKDVKCELCKSIIDYKDNRGLEYGMNELNIFEFERPSSDNWIILEALNTEQFSEEQVKVYHIFDFKQKKTLVVGRGYKADAKINDISISRVHAFLKARENEIWLQDSDSKFGCLYLQ
ncbi:unnamed protein product [Moneuplotes crassus]|uniref:Uncharacterized protein n=1 Tax=Euplotes crassus TaxID=5936 RepID=A0AAD1Y6J8_EUPCR|nr:unnamed protein product [Moneuplotes crassus]